MDKLTDAQYIAIARDAFGSAVRDNSKEQLVAIGKAYEDGLIDND